MGRSVLVNLERDKPYAVPNPVSVYVIVLLLNLYSTPTTLQIARYYPGSHSVTRFHLHHIRCSLPAGRYDI